MSHHHEHAAHADHATVLDLDGEVLGSHLDAVLAWAADGLVPRVVADLGAGTGTGTRLLARRFPAATITAVDLSEEHLAHLRSTYDGDRLRTVAADLDAGWPAEVTGVDLVWTASALHHLTRPGALLEQARAALAPGGVLVAVEIHELPRFLPPRALDGLEDRLQEAMAAAGWNHHPDWRPDLEAAGFTVEQRVVGGTVTPLPPATATYARAWLGRVRQGLADRLTSADLAALDGLLGDGPDALRHRDDLTVRGSRSAWVGR